MSERIPVTLQRQTRGTGPILRRKCACGGSGGSGGECAECKKKKLQRRAAGSGPETAPPIVNKVLRAPGQPLDAQTRAYFEPRFGHDFSKVRVHTDAEAAESAHAVNALAYTVGHQVVFESARFDPRSDTGQELIAHELAHVVQQSGQQNNRSGLTVAAGNDAFEHDADRVAQRALAGDHAQPPRKLAPAVQRQVPPTSPGPPTMQGLDWGLNCDWSKFPPKCSVNIQGVDVPIDKDHWRCVVLAREGRCPPECKDEVEPLGIPCVQPEKPNFPGKSQTHEPECPPGQIPIAGRCISFRPPTGGPTSQPCPPDQIPTITGGCAPMRVPSSPTTPPGPTAPPLQQPGTHVRVGTIESETLDNFALNDPNVPSQYAQQLDHLAGLLNVYREVEVHIEGHTDGSGTEAINIPLSQQRAEAVKAQLIRRHIVNPGRVKTTGFSSHRPQVPTQQPKAQEARNRRVEIWYYIPPAKGVGEGLEIKTKP